VSDGTRAVEALIREAWTAHGEGRYARSVDAAGRAMRIAEQLDDPGLLVRALVAEAEPILMLGDKAGALVRYTRVLGLAGDPASADRLGERQAAKAVFMAYLNWVVCARFMTGIAWPELFGVLDEAERWLAATGHRDWRCGVLLQRAGIHDALKQWDQAAAFAQEALAVYNPDAPGYTVATYRSELGAALRNAGRAAEAQPHYQAILDDPDTSNYGRKVAYQGLAWCALADGNPKAARQHAQTAVRLAEPLGDDALCTALGTLVAACRAVPDLDTAWQAVTRHLDAATRIGGHYRPYHAIRDAVDIALDRNDLETARRLLADLDTHATALDTTAATTIHSGETAQRHHRLATLDTGGDAG
jgi:tetratricopeptide (TPR) repeat protein